METKYQVFVSSTYKDLTEERRKVMQALLELDCIPVGMELFLAADDDQWTLIKKLIDGCDYYVLVIGGRYGSLNSKGLSFTQMEYEYALSKQIPIIAFLHKNPDDIKYGKSEMDPTLKPKLESFRAKVQRKMCKYWENPDDLGSQVSRSLVKLIKDKPRPGWVKASDLPSQRGQGNEVKLENELHQLTRDLMNRSGGERFIGEWEGHAISLKLPYLARPVSQLIKLRGKGERARKIKWNSFLNKVFENLNFTVSYIGDQLFKYEGTYVTHFKDEGKRTRPFNGLGFGYGNCINFFYLYPHEGDGPRGFGSFQFWVKDHPKDEGTGLWTIVSRDKVIQIVGKSQVKRVKKKKAAADG